MSHQILIVDDSRTVRTDLTVAFRSAAMTATAVGTLAEARELLADAPVSAIVLDVVLPDGDGCSFLAELHDDPATGSIPVVLLSERAAVDDRIRGLEVGQEPRLDTVPRSPKPIHVVPHNADGIGR